MDYLIKKSDSSIVEEFPGGATKVKLPEQSGGDVIFVGDKRPVYLGGTVDTPAKYVLVKGIEVEEPLTKTTKRGDTTTVVVDEIVTVTKTAVTKGATDLLNDVIRARHASIANGGFGTWQEQFEILGEQGIEQYQAHIAAVKVKYPKE